MLVWRTRYDGILCIDELDDYVRTSSRTAVPFLETKLLGIRVHWTNFLELECICPQNGTAVLEGYYRKPEWVLCSFLYTRATRAKPLDF